MPAVDDYNLWLTTVIILISLQCKTDWCWLLNIVQLTVYFSLYTANIYKVLNFS